MAAVTISEYDATHIGQDGYADGETPLPKTTPAGYKVVRARYNVEKISVWIVPDNVDETKLWCKWDQLHYEGKNGVCSNIEFQKVVNDESFDGDDYKRPAELKICIANDDELSDNSMYFDTSDEFDKEELEKNRKAVSELE
jgi:hypothetical protein